MWLCASKAVFIETCGGLGLTPGGYFVGPCFKFFKARTFVFCDINPVYNLKIKPAFDFIQH